MYFKTVSDIKVNPISYTTKIIQDNPFVEIHIGTDSQRNGEGVCYVTALAYRYPMRGVHYIYKRIQVPPIKDNFTRLWKETEMSLDLAEKISQNFPGLQISIDMDYNDDKYYVSNKLVSAAKGWAKGCGYKVNIKPNKQIATRAADYHCK